MIETQPVRSVNDLPDFRRDPELVAAVERRDSLSIQCNRAHRELQRLLKIADAVNEVDVASAADAAARAQRHYRDLTEQRERAEARVIETETRAKAVVIPKLRRAALDALKDAIAVQTAASTDVWDRAMAVRDLIGDQFVDFRGLYVDSSLLVGAIYQGHATFGPNGPTLQHLRFEAEQLEQAIVQAELREDGVRDEALR